MIRTLIYVVLLATNLAALNAAHAADAARLDDISLMALGPLDGRAVVKSSDGKMHVLKVGATLPGTQAVIEQVLNDKVIAIETIMAADKTTKKVTVWISKAAPGEKSSVQRMEAEAPAVPAAAENVSGAVQAEEPPAPVTKKK